jgi:hypothetical protein
MAHFARVVENVVVDLHVVANAVITDDNGVEQENLGQQFLSGLYGFPADQFLQCSYNGSMRGVYPGVGWGYDLNNDVFVAPPPVDVADEAF